MQLSQSIKRNHYFRHIRFFLKELFDDELTYYAASLSFYTISTIIPLLVIVFALIPKLERFDQYYADLKTMMIEHLLPVQSEAITNYIDTFIENSAQLGIISLTITIFISLLFFINFSYVVNSVFKAKDQGYIKIIVTYLLLVIFVPIGLLFSFYLTSTINQFITTLSGRDVIEVSALLPYVIEWSLFFIIYKIAPNVYVYYKSAAISALIAMLIWGSSKAVFVHYIFYAKATNTLYGPFAVMIFALTWVYLSWIIFVYGLRLCYLINRSYGYSKSHQQ